MKREEKAQVMNRTSNELNKAKDEICKASEMLRMYGMDADAEKLMILVYKLEVFQNKYN